MGARLWPATAGPAVGTGDLGNLPADTDAAFSFSGAGQAIAKAWPSLPQEVKASLGEYGLTLPDDLVALLGNTFTVSVSGTTIKQLASFPQTLEVGLRVNTDEAVRAQKVLRILAADLLPEGDLTTVDGSILVAATTTDYLDRMSGTGGRLSGEDKFLKALPDHAKANQACYVDLEAALADAHVQCWGLPRVRVLATQLRRRVCQRRWGGLLVDVGGSLLSAPTQEGSRRFTRAITR